MLVAVIDGLGGGIGSQLVSQLKAVLLPGSEVIALGTNSAATEAMIRAGANRGATGENAIRVMVAQADVILGPLGIIIPDAMMGEITVAMAEAVVASPAKKLLLPVTQPHVELVGITSQPLGGLIRIAVQRLTEISKE
ncbi:MAG: DUF3842 family protein [Firmicutes bacterium]|jgi:hypothetical protein|nr:DUF3842 family protein [Bacillota bacterium]